MTQLDQLPEAHSLYASIGRVVAEFGRLEHVLDLIIEKLEWREFQSRNLIRATIVQPDQRIALLETLIKPHASQVILDQFAKLKLAVSQLIERRNRVVHDIWFFGGAANESFAVFKDFQGRSRGPQYGDFESHPISEVSLLELVADIRSASVLADDLCDLLNAGFSTGGGLTA